MTFPTIPTVAAGRALTTTQANTTATRTFPSLTGLTKNSGDLLIAIVVAYQTSTGTNAAFSGWTGGFTEFHDSATSTTMAMGAAYKWSTGSETGTFAVTQAGTITGHAGMILLSIPGAHRTTPPEAGSRASGTSSSADPASFNPSGWDVEDTLWISVAGSGETSTTGSYTGLNQSPQPTYGSDVKTGISADVVGGIDAGVGFAQIAAAAEDVGTWGCDTSNARNAAFVIAVRPIPNHDATGDLTGQGSTVAGSASRTAGTVNHAATGDLSGPGTTVAGTAARTRAHPSTGVLAGPGATVAGTSARTRAHPSTGVLTGPGSTVAGSAARSGGATTHDASGALTAPGAVVVGSSARTRQHPSSGVLAGPGSAVAGTSARTRAHPSSGVLAGQGSTVAGTSARTRAHPSTGVLAGPGAEVSGAAARSGGATTHEATGALSGPGAAISGAASRASAPAVAQTPAGSSTTNNNRTKSQKRRKVIIGDRLYEVDSLRDVEFLLKRIVREEAEPVAKAAKARVRVVDRVSAKLDKAEPVALPMASVEVDWSGLWKQLASQDRAYADLLVKAIVRQEEEDIESLLLLI